MTRCRLVLTLALAVAFCVGTPMVIAQGVQTATISGTVTDADGKALPGVTVTATSPAQIGERSVVTDENGEYIFKGLAPGSYAVTFVLDGMQTVEATKNAQLGLTSKVDAQMAPAEAVTETIQVVAEA